MKSALFIILTDNVGGAERISVSLANRLSGRSEWSVKLLIAGCRNEDSFVERTASPRIVRLYGRFSRERLSFVTLPLRLLWGQHDLIFTTHVHTNALTSCLQALGLIRSARLVGRESTTVFDRFTGIRRAVFALLYRFYGVHDVLIAQTQYMAEHVAPHVPERARRALRVLPNPIDLAFIERAVSETLPAVIAVQLAGRRSILVCGRLIDVKQPMLAIQAFSILRRRIAGPWQLVFVGDGALRSALEAEVVALELSNDVVFLGQQSNPYAIMRACEYGLLTSAREGFPNVVLEMMACGIRKVVMTPCAGDLDSLSGVSVTVGFSATELADSLAEAILSDEDNRQTYRAMVAQRSVDRYLDVVLGVDNA